MLIARGAPTHREVTKTDNGGKKGRIALEILGKNLQMLKEKFRKRKKIKIIPQFKKKKAGCKVKLVSINFKLI